MSVVIITAARPSIVNTTTEMINADFPRAIDDKMEKKTIFCNDFHGIQLKVRLSINTIFNDCIIHSAKP